MVSFLSTASTSMSAMVCDAGLGITGIHVLYCEERVA